MKLGVRTDLVFANSEGAPIMRKNLVRRHFKPALKAGQVAIRSFTVLLEAHMREFVAASWHASESSG